MYFAKCLFAKNYNADEYSQFFFIFYASPFHIHRTFNNKRNISDLQKNTTITFNVNSLHFDPHIRIFIYVPWNLKIHLMRLIIILDWIYGLFFIYSKRYSQTNHLLDARRWDEVQSVVSDEQWLVQGELDLPVLALALDLHQPIPLLRLSRSLLKVFED